MFDEESIQHKIGDFLLMIQPFLHNKNALQMDGPTDDRHIVAAVYIGLQCSP